MTEFKQHHPPHIYEANAIYFITASTVYKTPFFNSAEKKRLLQSCLTKASKKYLDKLIAWVIIDWHYHLLIKVSTKENLIGFIKSFHGSSAIAINKVDNTPGRQIWYQYFDRFPRDEKEMYAYFNYCHINPIRHDLLPNEKNIITIKKNEIIIEPDQIQNIIKILSEYPFSSFNHYLKLWKADGMASAFRDYPIRLARDFD